MLKIFLLCLIVSYLYIPQCYAQIIIDQKDLKPLKGSETEYPNMLAGINSYQNANYSDAIENFTYATFLNPSNEEAFFYLANSYFLYGKYNLAIINYERAISLDKTRPEFLL